MAGLASNRVSSVILPLDGEGGTLNFERAGWGETSYVRYRLAA